MNIRKAIPEDAGRINKLSVQYLLTDITDPARNGFLVSAYNQVQYENLINKVDFFYVAEINNVIVAFIMAYSDHYISDDAIKRLSDQRVGGSFILIKQICVDISQGKQGIGGELYKFLMNRTHPMPVLAAIVLDPENTVSINFHNKLGFEKIFEFIPSDGMLRGMWAIGV